MDKKELAELIAKIEYMRLKLVLMESEFADLSSKLRFIPVSASSSSSDHEDANDEHSAGMRP